MHFHNGNSAGNNGITQRDRRMCISTWVEHYPIRPRARILQSIYQGTFMIRLKTFQIRAEFLSQFDQLCIYIIQHHRTINFRLTRTKQVQIRPMQYQDFHDPSSAISRSATSTRTTLPISTGKAKRITPFDFFLSSLMARISSARGKSFGIWMGSPSSDNDSLIASDKPWPATVKRSASFASTTIPIHTASPCRKRNPLTSSTACPTV